MIQTYRFVVPMPGNVTNRRSGGGHWWSAHREKKEYWKSLDWWSLYLNASAVGATFTHPGYTIPKPPKHPLEWVSLRSVMYLGAPMDEDNAMARHKPLLDWLTTRGYIVDDKKKHVAWKGFPRQEVKRGQDYRIELTLVPR